MYILEVGKPVGPLVLELQAAFAFLPLPNHTRILELFLVADKQLFVHSSVARPSVWGVDGGWTPLPLPTRPQWYRIPVSIVRCRVDSRPERGLVHLYPVRHFDQKL